MAGVSAEDFERHVLSICSASSAVKNIAIVKSGLTWLNVRAYLIDDSFVEIFHNRKTGKTAFAHIRDERRIFGADNKEGWHWHPREDPSSHVHSTSPITFEEFLNRVEEHLKK